MLEDLIREKLKPIVKQIDLDGFYPKEYLISLGKAGLLQSDQLNDKEMIFHRLRLVEETAKVCMTTGFTLWCHLAALTYLQKSGDQFLKETLLRSLETGQLLGGTGLSNPMKYYAGLEPLHLKAVRAKGGYVVSGQLPAVSNLGDDHWFGMIASVSEQQRIMAIIPCDHKGLTLKEKKCYIGLNGSATYTCVFHDVFVSNQWVIAENADQFVEMIRPLFVLYQIPLGFGGIEVSIQSIKKIRNKQSGSNQYLNIQPEQLEYEFKQLRERYDRIIQFKQLAKCWHDILKLRLDTAYLTLKAAHASMLHYGSAAYLQKSDPSRRLREAYFFINLTPTVKHLEKSLSHSK